MTTDLLELGIAQAAALLRSGEISSRDLTKACLESIQNQDADLHAFLTLTPEEALFRANRADYFFQQARHGQEQPLHPMLGIPLAIKDVLALSGVRCTCGSYILENYVPPFTATSVDKLLDAGVIILGKTNTDEFAMGSSTENSAYGPTHNPWNFSTRRADPAAAAQRQFQPGWHSAHWVLIPAAVYASRLPIAVSPD